MTKYTIDARVDGSLWLKPQDAHQPEVDVDQLAEPEVCLATEVYELLEAIKASLTGPRVAAGRYSEKSRRWIDSDTLRLVDEALEVA